MALSRKRRADDEDNDASQGYEDETPRNTQRRRRRQADESEGEAEETTQGGGDVDTLDGLISKLVRYALACEYSRQNIRREGIREKVIGKQGRGISFNKIFEGAQKELQIKFGMQMVELPAKDKITLRERRDAAQKNTQTSSGSSSSYILTSILPKAYRVPKIMPPSSVPTTELEATYIGLYTTIISLIYLAGGSIAEGKLDRYLKRLNANENTPLDSTPKLLAKMVKDGYVIRVKESSNGEEFTEWRVGPRGKVEVGPVGVAGLVEHVYGANAPNDLAKRIQSSLGSELVRKAREENDAEEEDQENRNEASGLAPPRRAAPS